MSCSRSSSMYSCASTPDFLTPAAASEAYSCRSKNPSRAVEAASLDLLFRSTMGDRAFRTLLKLSLLKNASRSALSFLPVRWLAYTENASHAPVSGPPFPPGRATPAAWKTCDGSNLRRPTRIRALVRTDHANLTQQVKVRLVENRGLERGAVVLQEIQIKPRVALGTASVVHQRLPLAHTRTSWTLTNHPSLASPSTNDSKPIFASIKFLSLMSDKLNDFHTFCFSS